jgi:hypothetical protein
MSRQFHRLLFLAILGTLVGAVTANGQTGQNVSDSAKRSGIRRLLAVQRTDSLILEGLDKGFAAQPDSPDLPPGFMDSLRVRLRREIAQFVERLVPVYDSLYTTAEIDQLLTFYQSRLGQRFLQTQPRLAEALMSLGQQWGMEMAGRVMVDLSRLPRKPS